MKRPNNDMKKGCTNYCLAIPSESQICQDYIIVSKRNLLDLSLHSLLVP